MNKFKNNYKGSVKAYPLMMNISALIFGIIFQKPILLYYGVYSYSCDLINHLIKKFFKNIIYKKNDKIPILGLGKRPQGAKYCSIFINEDNLSGVSNTFGMPSGHSNTAMLNFVFWTLYIINNFELNIYSISSICILFFISLNIMISRIIFKCHTPQQVILGGIIGIILGFIGYQLFIVLKNNINKNIENKKEINKINEIKNNI